MERKPDSLDAVPIGPFLLYHRLNHDLDSFQASSSGLASGNNLHEALSHAICELVERDAFTLFQTSSREYQDSIQVDLNTVDEPGCRNLLELFDRAGVAVGVWEMTDKIGISCFECAIADRREDPGHPVVAAGGAGCHPAREIALSRALTEAAQSRLTYIAGSRDDMPRSEYLQHLDPMAIGLSRERVSRRGARDFHDAPAFYGASIEDDLGLGNRAPVRIRF